jgi:hypothetical protein
MDARVALTSNGGRVNIFIDAFFGYDFERMNQFPRGRCFSIPNIESFKMIV